MKTATRRAPDDLCAEHKRIWLAWREYHYDPRNPRDPGGQLLMDARTTHTERAARWDEFNGKQMDATEACCRSGTSPQCTTESKEEV